MRGKFLIKGGKGKIGVGERQVSEEDIVTIYEDHSLELINLDSKLTEASSSTNINTLFLHYAGAHVFTVDNNDFSNSRYFGSGSPYVIIKNSQKEFFLGVNKNNIHTSRLDPRGIMLELRIELYDGLSQSNLIGFYCLANEKPIYNEGRILFYKIYPTSSVPNTFDFSESIRYSFSVVRENIPQLENTINLPLIDISPNANVIVNEIKAEVRAGILYLTIKDVKSSIEGIFNFIICELPEGYRPKRNINVLFSAMEEGTSLGEVRTDGSVSISTILENNIGQYLQISLPL